MCRMKSDKQFIIKLEDNIRKRRVIDMLIKNWAQVEISNKVKDVSRVLFIDD